MPPVQLVDDRGWQGHCSDLREHGSDLDLPRVLHLQGAKKITHHPTDAHRPGEGCRRSERQSLQQAGDRPAQRAFQEFALGMHEAELSYGVLEHLPEEVAVCGFGEEPEDVPLVDCCNSGLEIGITRQQHAHGVRLKPAYLSQHTHAVYAGHPHVGDHDREGRRICYRPNTFLATLSGRDGEERAQDPGQAVEQSGFVVDQKQAGKATGRVEADLGASS
jgi:hypothetical protein